MRRPPSLSRNHYFVIGLLFGLALSFYIPQDIWELVQQEECPQEAAENILIEKFGQDFEPHLNLVNKPLEAKKPVKNVIRPRYYSSELGIREKIFIGVMTSQANINGLATAFNRTTAHLVNRIKFFIDADSVKTNYKLKNIVGFTDTRENLRPFHVIKYIADNYLDDYDYFLLVPDTVYVDARKLNTLLYHMSITFDIYMGTTIGQLNGDEGVGNVQQKPAEDSTGGGGGGGVNSDASASSDKDIGQGDRNYCALEAGILLSSGVIRKMRNNLDWCVRNGITNEHSVNIGRCVKYASNVAGCQQSFQGIKQQTYSLHAQSRRPPYKDLSAVAKEQAFRNATTVFPVTNPDDFYRLHAYYSKYHLELVQQRGYELEQKSYRIANGSISNKILEIRWPLGVPLSSAPETRHDILTWHLINRTHIYMPNAAHVVAPLTRIEALDFEQVLTIALQYAGQKHPQLEFIDLHSVYRKFDATRGMDYQLHLNFREPARRTLGRGRIARTVVKSFEVVKPLGRVEVVPSPYVTESTRIAILVPTFEHQLTEALQFITHYEHTCMQNQDNTFLLMIFLYRADSPSKGELDPFKRIKTLALDLSTKYKTDGSRIAWVSIRLPEQLSIATLPTDADMLLNTLYARHEILSIAVADLALPKIGLDSLVLMASTGMSFKTDFLNRVRMNTIQGFQVYAPVGFQMYPCKWLSFCKECDTCDVSQSSGYFDKHNFDVIAFYSRDYVQARKLLDAHGLPIIHNDNDIELLMTASRANKSINNILDMFVASQHTVHILRGVEPNLRFGIAIRNFIERLQTLGTSLPQCPAKLNNDAAAAAAAAAANADMFDMPPRNDVDDGGGGDGGSTGNQAATSVRQNSDLAHKCIHLASRKQIGDAIIRYEDKSIQLK